MTEAPIVYVFQTAPRRPARPWLHALTAYAAVFVTAVSSMALSITLQSAFWKNRVTNPSEQDYAVADSMDRVIWIGTIVVTTGVLALIAWLYNRTGKRWIWGAVIGLTTTLIGPNFIGLLGYTPLALLHGLPAALATLILYKGAPRVTGIVLLCLVVGLLIVYVVVILIALATWRFTF